MTGRFRPRVVSGARRAAAPGWPSAALGGLAVTAFVPTLLHLGWRAPVFDPWMLNAAQITALAVYAALLLYTTGLRPASWAARRSAGVVGGYFEPAMVALGLFSSAWWPGMNVATTALVLLHLLRTYLWLTRIAPPGLIFVGSFLALITIGTLGLMLPAATPPDQPIGALDAVFTVTSAISQTGLVVRPTGEGFTRFGQIIILIWIQVGALGVIVFGVVLAAVTGSSFGLRATKTIAESTEQGWSGQLSLRKLVIFTMIVTHAVEAVGAAAFYYGWPETWNGAPGMASAGDRLYHSIFFSVSSFCNAGFSTTANSMQGLRAHWTPHLVIVPLIVLGSIGFPVLDNLRRVALARVRGRHTEDGALVRLNLNSKIVLTTTLFVYIIGLLLIFTGELSQADQPWSLALLDAHFMTINRTSGFDTIAPQQMGLLGQLSLIFLMFIGGSPGSVAGGCKMMVFAVLLLTVWSTLTGRRSTEAFGRTLPDELVRKSATLIVLCLVTVLTVAGVLAATESGPTGHSLDALLFEAVSAFGTTGLSMGITADLGVPSRIALIVAMFIGRVGPLAFMAALISIGAARRPRYAFPTEEVVVY